MIIGEVRRYLRDYNSIRVSRSLRDIAYKAIYTREAYMKQNLREPTINEISEEIGIEKEMIVYAMDAIQSPVSLFEPVYSEGGDTLYVMDQISDKKNREDRWIEDLSLREAMNHLGERERHIIQLRFYEGKSSPTSVDPSPFQSNCLTYLQIYFSAFSISLITILRALIRAYFLSTDSSTCHGAKIVLVF